MTAARDGQRLELGSGVRDPRGETVRAPTRSRSPAMALFCGLVGFAAHFVWIVAVLVMALGLAFIIADSRRNRIDTADQRSDKVDAGAS